jgi:hypothetical protein
MTKTLAQKDLDFIRFCIAELGITTSPNIRVGDDHQKAQDHRAMGYYSPKDNHIWVLRGDRIPADWYRTLAHELVHWRQREEGKALDGADGSEIENEANSKAAVLLREWGRRHDHIYVLDEEEPQTPVGAELPFDGGTGGDITGEPMVPYSV